MPCWRWAACCPPLRWAEWGGMPAGLLPACRLPAGRHCGTAGMWVDPSPCPPARPPPVCLASRSATTMKLTTARQRRRRRMGRMMRTAQMMKVRPAAAGLARFCCLHACCVHACCVHACCVHACCLHACWWPHLARRWALGSRQVTRREDRLPLMLAPGRFACRE